MKAGEELKTKEVPDPSSSRYSQKAKEQTLPVSQKSEVDQSPDLSFDEDDPDKQSIEIDKKKITIEHQKISRMKAEIRKELEERR